MGGENGFSQSFGVVECRQCAGDFCQGCARAAISAPPKKSQLLFGQYYSLFTDELIVAGKHF